MILKVFSCGPIETNVYLLACAQTKKAWVIDAPSDSLSIVKQQVASLGLTVEKICLTHSHWDHIADLCALKEHFKAPVAVHGEDAANVISPGADRLPLSFPIDAVTPEIIFADGDVFSLGSLRIEVIHTPGHTPGGVCLYIPSEGTLISGDTLFRGCMGRVDLPTSEPARMWKSLRRLAILPPNTKVFPGHGPSTTIGRESWMDEAEELFS